MNPSARSVLRIGIHSTDLARRVVTETPPEALDGPHAIILNALADLVDRGAVIDPTVVWAHLPTAVGGTRPDVLAEMIEVQLDQATAPSLGWHLNALQSVAVAARLHMVADTARQAAGEEEPNLALLRERLDHAATVRTGMLPTLADLLDLHLDALAEPDDTTCIPTGIVDFDRLLNGGMRPGQLVVIGARPGVGKSVLLLHAARHAALRCNTPVLMASLEMLHNEVQNRFLAAETRTDLAALIAHKLQPHELERVRDLAPRSGRFVIDDATSQTVRHITTAARSNRVGLVVVDYLQQLSAKDSANRQEQVAGLSRALKLMAMELQVPVLVAAQLNRAQTQRSDPKPRMSDLRESGAIEADADVIGLLHRDPDDENYGTTAELIVAKNRSGSVGVVDLHFEGHYASIAGVAR